MPADQGYGRIPQPDRIELAVPDALGAWQEVLDLAFVDLLHGEDGVNVDGVDMVGVVLDLAINSFELGDILVEKRYR